jgi:hypothetical protein
MKFIIFGVILTFLDSDPGSESGSGSETLALDQEPRNLVTEIRVCPNLQFIANFVTVEYIFEVMFKSKRT